MARKLPTFIDLFCGAGGFSLGFRAAGARALAAADFDEIAALTYTKNFRKLQPKHPPTVCGGDAGNLAEIDLGSVWSGKGLDVLIGGPPCQGFSRVGRGRLNRLSEGGHAADPRNRLYLAFMEAAQLWDPSAIVIENVPGMLSADASGDPEGTDEGFAEQVANDLIELGYRVGFARVNAAWYGVPQARDRLIFVAIKKGIRAAGSDALLQPTLPPTTHRAELSSAYATASAELFLPFDDLHHDIHVDTTGAVRAATTVAEAIGDLPPITEHLEDAGRRRPSFTLKRAHGVPLSSFARMMRAWPGLRAPRTLRDHVVRRTPRDYEIFHRMKPGDRYVEARRHARAIFDEFLAIARSGAVPAPGTPEWERRKYARDFIEPAFARLARSGALPEEGTAEFLALQERFIPKYPEDIFKDKWRKLIPDQPSWTVPAHLAKDAYSHIHYDSEQARSISVREAARLQSFPDGFEFEGNMGDRFRQIGNAVPPLLAWAIGAHVLKMLGYRAQQPRFEPGPTPRRPRR